MKACVIRGTRELVVEERPEPQPGAGQVLVALGAGGICGSDLHYYSEGGVGDFRLREPMILGHEVAGVVVEAGSDVSLVRPGTRVAVNPNHPCGACPECLHGRGNLCRDVRFFGSAARFPHVQGAFTERFLASEANCFPIPDDLPFAAAACAEPLAVALHAVEQAGSLLGRSVLISGAGPIGVLTAAAARLAGAARICITDLYSEPLTIAGRMGATETVNVQTGGERMAAFGEGRGSFDAGFEASGNASALASLLLCVAPGGTIVQIGMLGAGNTSAPLQRLVAKELRLIGTFRFYREFAWAVAALSDGRVDVSPMLSKTFDLRDVVPAFDAALDRSRSMKVSLAPGLNS